MVENPVFQVYSCRFRALHMNGKLQQMWSDENTIGGFLGML